MGDPSIWKKEISVARESEEQTREPAEPERPIWRQELSFVRTTKRHDDAEETATSETPIDPSSLVPGTVPEPGLEEPGAEPGADWDEPAEDEALWLRAVMFGRKAESQVPGDDEAGLEPADEVPAWTPEAVPELRLDQPDAEPDEVVEPARTTDAWSEHVDPPGDFWSALSEAQSEPAPVRATKDRSLPVLVGGCTALLVAALLGALFMIGGGKLASARRSLDDLNRQAEALAPSLRRAERQQLAGEQSAHVSALATALASRVSWDGVFRDLSLVLPHDVRLTSLTAKSAISAASTVPPTFTFRGRASSQQSVARLLSRLRVEHDLTNVRLISSTRSKIGNQPVVVFTIAGALASPAGGGS